MDPSRPVLAHGDVLLIRISRTHWRPFFPARILLPGQDLILGLLVHSPDLLIVVLEPPLILLPLVSLLHTLVLWYAAQVVNVLSPVPSYLEHALLIFPASLQHSLGARELHVLVTAVLVL